MESIDIILDLVFKECLFLDFKFVMVYIKEVVIKDK